MKSIKSIRRGERLTILILVLFFIGMGILVFKVVRESNFYMSHSDNVTLGKVYDRNGDVLFDPKASKENYDASHFLDIGNLIGDDSGQMTNTLVSENIENLQNYSLIFGASAHGQTAIHTTLDHEANRKVYDAFGSKDGTAIAYNYKTGEILVCVSKPNVNILDHYENIAELPAGSLICKAFYETAPGSTQKVATTAVGLESLGYDALMAKSYTCNGTYTTKYKQEIRCHELSGHGTQNVIQAFENSCNPWYAQLVRDLPLDSIINTYRRMGIAVNDDQVKKIDIDGITAFSASTKLTDTEDFDTMWSCMGQSEALASPCQMMLWESAIANASGRMTDPYLIAHMISVTGATKKSIKTTYSDSIFSSSVASQLREIMIQNGQDKYNGTIGYPVGVKSGTAQVKNGASENSLLTGFVDDVNLPIAFCVVIENRVSGELSTSELVSTMLHALDS